MPVLVDGDLAVWDTQAIYAYVRELPLRLLPNTQYPEPDTYPPLTPGTSQQMP